MPTRYVHLHGFASGADSDKGRVLARAFDARGAVLERPDLNRPSFARLTYTACLRHLDDLLAGSDKVRLSGSSMGGYLAARWAELQPTRVDRLLLLCPSFALPSRWARLLGAAAMERWQRDGELPLPDRSGNAVGVHWALVEDARRHPDCPEVPCSTVIVHGRDDELVPIEGSRAYARARPHVRLIEVDDGHRLAASLELVEKVALEHLLEVS